MASRRSLLFGLISLLLIGAISCKYANFSRSIVDGQAYGFAIGMGKQQARAVIEKKYSTADMSVMSVAAITKVDIDDSDFWVINLGGDRANRIHLYFENRQLTRIERERKWFSFEP
jgi:hypothetical protein